MKLWLISQDENCDYDTYDSAVVAAETAEDAKTVHPTGAEGWSDEYDIGRWCSSPAKVSVKLLGDAAPEIERGIILGSFNAG